MDKLSPKERYIRTLEGKETDRVSCSCPLQTGTVSLMEKTGSYWPDAHKNANKMADLAYGAWEHAGIGSVRVPFCLTVEAEAQQCIDDGVEGAGAGLWSVPKDAFGERAGIYKPRKGPLTYLFF
ncbi:MAG TPA: uroporphyrinogen decarboxylase family protein [Candidatus Methanofastidiosa archaeon]|nr:uroporphyrinogen decarboxylase family protein [Candidatus Methanofastidiosa archaeon]